jgi:CRP-like cAMP-binding protein
MQNLIEPAPELVDLRELQALCPAARFEPGEVLRQAGQHYRDMYLITGGIVDVALAGRDGTSKQSRSAGSSVGEIGFLRGCPAIATVTARSVADALVIDDAMLARLEADRPALAARLMRHLAQTAEQRTGPNLIFEADAARPARRTAIDVYLCRNSEMLEKAQRLRYDVYCGELGRQSPNADHGRGIIADNLDRFGHCFIAVEAGETIGTLRLNLTSEGPLGMVEELYGMRSSPHYPAAISVCTKFIVEKAKRRGPAALRLIAAVVRFGVRQNAKECYVDCIPALLPYYEAMGFKICGKEFLHRENGVSHPLVLDVMKHGKRLSRDHGAAQRLGFYVKAKTMAWIGRVRGRSRRPGVPDGGSAR